MKQDTSMADKIPTVSFVTSCWEANWEVTLKTRYLRTMIGRNKFPFHERLLFINNVSDLGEVCRYADQLVAAKVLTGYHVVENHAKEAIERFEVQVTKEEKGYYYLIADLVAVMLCQSDYLVHYTTDSLLLRAHDWITPCLRELARQPRAMAANPLWTKELAEPRGESFAETVNFFLGYRFSDQCYLIETRRFQQPIYNEHNPLSDGSPEHAGNSFERRVDAWMRNHAEYKLTYRGAVYRHENFVKGFPEQRRQLRRRWIF